MLVLTCFGFLHLCASRSNSQSAAAQCSYESEPVCEARGQSHTQNRTKYKYDIPGLHYASLVLIYLMRITRLCSTMPLWSLPHAISRQPFTSSPRKYDAREMIEPNFQDSFQENCGMVVVMCTNLVAVEVAGHIFIPAETDTRVFVPHALVRAGLASLYGWRNKKRISDGTLCDTVSSVCVSSVCQVCQVCVKCASSVCQLSVKCVSRSMSTQCQACVKHVSSLCQVCVNCTS